MELLLKMMFGFARVWLDLFEDSSKEGLMQQDCVKVVYRFKLPSMLQSHDVFMYVHTFRNSKHKTEI